MFGEQQEAAMRHALKAVRCPHCRSLPCWLVVLIGGSLVHASNVSPGPVNVPIEYPELESASPELARPYYSYARFTRSQPHKTNGAMSGDGPGSSGNGGRDGVDGSAGTEPPGQGGAKKHLAQPRYRTLQRLLQDLEESDYAGIGAWGSFSTPRRRVSRSFSTQRQPDGQPGQQQPPPPPPPPPDWRERQHRPSSHYGQPPPPPPPPGPVPESFWSSAGRLRKGQSVRPSTPDDRNGQMDLVPFDPMRLQAYGAVTEEEMMYLEQWASKTQILSLASVARIGVMVMVATILAYLAVVPRSAPTHQYNYLFKFNLLLVLASLSWPLLLLSMLWRPHDVNINALVKTYYTACTWGYCVALMAEIAVATAVKGAAFAWLEPAMLDICTDVPIIHLPWVWKRRCKGYRPKLSTLLASDILINCAATPLIEEVLKLWSYRWCTRVRNRKRRLKGRRHDSVHGTLVYMIAAAMGLKAADNTRRILLYTKPHQTSKTFFAFARGVYPVHELCGAFTALNIVRHDIMGESMPWWRILAPAVVLHSMSCFRGMKPLFKWASGAPWTEMQIQSLTAPDYATAVQQVWKAVLGLVWFAVLARVLGYLLYRNYVLSRQARMMGMGWLHGGLQ